MMALNDRNLYPEDEIIPDAFGLPEFQPLTYGQWRPMLSLRNGAVWSY